MGGGTDAPFPHGARFASMGTPHGNQYGRDFSRTSLLIWISCSLWAYLQEYPTISTVTNTELAHLDPTHLRKRCDPQLLVKKSSRPPHTEKRSAPHQHSSLTTSTSKQKFTFFLVDSHAASSIGVSMGNRWHSRTRPRFLTGYGRHCGC